MKARQREESPSHNLPLELTWTGIPLILVIVIFFFGFKGFLDMATPPANAYEILVDGQKWNWSFHLPERLRRREPPRAGRPAGPARDVVRRT